MQADTNIPLSRPADGARLIGIAAMALTVLIWAAFALTTRATAASPLAFGDVALARALVPGLVFLPFLPARLKMIRRAGWRCCAVIAVGAGIPFFALAVTGGALTSAAHVAALIAGMAPVGVAILMRLLTGTSPSRRGMLALCVITGGALLLIVAQGQALPWQGAAALLCASLFWAAYTIAMRVSGLDPVGCALVIALPSSALMLGLVATGTVPTNWGQYSLIQALPFVLVQGLGVGVIASVTYGFAIMRLGAERCATMGAAAPALAALMAIPLLSEPLSLVTLAGIVLIGAGVAAFNCG
ncbi:DMT family transporter [Sagittula sp. SSi028]|uniref:DMT family transporter n=1 Tax=Sagittula sp. SSi028 TaxID=3400636 RepID=UPI003AF63C39